MVAKHCELVLLGGKEGSGRQRGRGGERTKPLGEARATSYTASDKGVVLA